MTRLPAPPQREHPLGLPDERRDRRGARGGARRPLADFLGGRAVRDRLRRQHDDAHLPPRRARSAGGWTQGDEIVVTELDHHANVDPWRRWRASAGSACRAVRFLAETGQLDLGDLAAADRARAPASSRSAPPPTRSARSTTCAAPPISPTRAGALVFVDAVHYAPHALVDVGRARRRLPRLLGLQVLRAARRRPLGPAGRCSRSSTCPSSSPRPRTRPSASRPARRTTRASSAPRRPSISWPRSPDGADRRDAPRRRASRRSTRAARRSSSGCGAGLRAIAGRHACTARRPAQPRTPTVAFTVRGRTSEDVARALADAGRLRLERRLLRDHRRRRLGHAEDGLVRAGCACYTTPTRSTGSSPASRSSSVTAIPARGGRAPERRVATTHEEAGRLPARRWPLAAAPAFPRPPRPSTRCTSCTGTPGLHRLARRPRARRLSEAARGPGRPWRCAQGEVVADIGAGSGYFTVRFARAVGDKGRVYAVDISPDMIRHLNRRVRDEGSRNVLPSCRDPDDPLLPGRLHRPLRDRRHLAPRRGPGRATSRR